MKVLLASNLDSRAPFGNFTRPFFLGRALAELGVEVANVSIDPSAIDFGPTARATPKPLARMAADIARAARRFGPDVIYAHEMRPALASLLVRSGVPVVADFHSLPSMELAGFARSSSGAEAVRLRAAAAQLRLSEEVVARRAHALVAAGDELREELARRLPPSADLLVVPNGVDPALLEARLAPESPYEPGVLNAVSTLPNSGNPSNARALRFLSEVAGELERRTPAVRVNVLGSAAGPGAPRVRYLGVQAELLPWIGHADTCLLPYPDDARLHGGARNKLLEYLARGRSLVTTTEGLRGLRDAGHDPKVTVAAAEPAAFAAAVMEAVERRLPPVDAAGPELSWRRHAPLLRDWLARSAA